MSNELALGFIFSLFLHEGSLGFGVHGFLSVVFCMLDNLDQDCIRYRLLQLQNRGKARKEMILHSSLTSGTFTSVE